MQRLIHLCNQYLIYIVGAIFLMTICFYNGYPLYMGDTHAYVTIASTDIIPFDRSPFYGWFIRHSSLRESLWLTVLAQNLLLSYVLIRYYRLLSGATGIRVSLIFLILTVSCTYVSWAMSCLMSDAFTPILLLSCLLFLYEENAIGLRQYIYLLLIFLSVSMHNSHFLILALVALSLCVYAVVKKRKLLLKKSVLLVCTSVLYFFTMSAINSANGYGFVFSRASNLFMVSKFAETGILKEYLDHNCDKKQLKLCPYKDEITAYPWQFMFDKNSPYGKIGGYDASKEEFRTIIHDVFTDLHYIKLYLIKSLSFTAQQLFNIQEAGNVLQLPDWHAQAGFVAMYYPTEKHEFTRAKQNQGSLSNAPYKTINGIFLVLSSLCMLWYYPKMDKGKMVRIYLFLLLFYFVNALVTATGSTVDGRYSFRIFWIFPATNIAFLLNYFVSRKKKQQTSTERIS